MFNCHGRILSVLDSGFGIAADHRIGAVAASLLLLRFLLRRLLLLLSQSLLDCRIAYFGCIAIGAAAKVAHFRCRALALTFASPPRSVVAILALRRSAGECCIVIFQTFVVTCYSTSSAFRNHGDNESILPQKRRF